MEVMKILLLFAVCLLGVFIGWVIFGDTQD